MESDEVIKLEYLSSKLGIEPKALEKYRHKQSEEFYDLEYYMRTTYSWYRDSYDTIREIFLSYVPKKVHLTVDAGCGIGLYSRMLLERTEGYIGVDTSKSAINLAKEVYKGNKRMKFLCADIADVGIKENSADLIFCTEVVEHISDLIPIFKNFHRVLKTSGKVFLTTTTFYYYIAHVLTNYVYKDILKRRDFNSFIHRLSLYFEGFKSSENRSKFMKQGLERDDHVHAFTLKQLREIFDETGFDLEGYRYFNCKNIFPDLMFLKPINKALKKIFRKSRIYGPNIAMLLVPK